MRRYPEQTAWVVLLGSFSVFCLLITLVPLSSYWWVRQAAMDQAIRMTTTAGTVLVTRPGRDTPEVNLVDIPVGSVIVTSDANSQANLIFAQKPDAPVMAMLTIYGNTKVEVIAAHSPRFVYGQNPHAIGLRVESGRISLTLAESSPTAGLRVELRSAPNAITLSTQPGSEVSLEATVAQSSVTIRAGTAAVNGFKFSANQRAEVTNLGLIGPLPPEREFIRNGHFVPPLEADWEIELHQPQNQTESWGTVVTTTLDSRSAIRFLREGQDWGQVGIRQAINYDIRGFKTLRLRLELRIDYQDKDLYNCGALGSECPVMARLNYLDSHNQSREWLLGFYANPSAIFGLTSCPSCGAVNAGALHQLVQRTQWYSYESDNLLDVFSKAGAPAMTLQSITLYASGHSFDSAVTNVELLGSE